MGILPNLPRERAIPALAFGDEQFLFRYLALNLQNAGDTGGRVTPLRDYDYGQVIKWLELLNGLDLRSHWPISMANGYFGQTPKIEDVRPIVRYMQGHVAQQPELKWPWLVNGVFLSRHRLKSDWLALDVARQLAAYDYADMNSASLQMPPLVLDDLGQLNKAVEEMIRLRDRRGQMFRIEDQAWMDAYISETKSRIKAGVEKPK